MKDANIGYEEAARRTERLQAKLLELYPDGPSPMPGHPGNPIGIWSQVQIEAARSALEGETSDE
jgi:hypothetical protein